MTRNKKLKTRNQTPNFKPQTDFPEMPYNEELATRIREKLSRLRKIEEKKMMGGLIFMYNAKMCVGVMKDELMCRIDPEFHEDAIKKRGARTMDFTNRPMIGYVLINEDGIKTKKDFDYWMNLALDFNSRAKSPKKKK